MKNYSRYFPFIGRVMIGLPFVVSGVIKITAIETTVNSITAAGLPLPWLGWVVAVVTELGGGFLLLIGFRVRLAAVALALFSLATAVFFHRNFGNQGQMVHFFKDVMIAGGLLQIIHFGAGALSLDARKRLVEAEQ